MAGFLEYKEIDKFNRTYNPQMKNLDKKRKVGGGILKQDDFIGIDYKTQKKVCTKHSNHLF